LKPKYDEQLSNFAFNFDLRRYNQGRMLVPLVPPLLLPVLCPHPPPGT
jgi:hypothetical protein